MKMAARMGRKKAVEKLKFVCRNVPHSRRKIMEKKASKIRCSQSAEIQSFRMWPVGGIEKSKGCRAEVQRL